MMRRAKEYFDKPKSYEIKITIEVFSETEANGVKDHLRNHIQKYWSLQNIEMKEVKKKKKKKNETI